MRTTTKVRLEKLNQGRLKNLSYKKTLLLMVATLAMAVLCRHSAREERLNSNYCRPPLTQRIMIKMMEMSLQTQDQRKMRKNCKRLRTTKMMAWMSLIANLNTLRCCLMGS